MGNKIYDREYKKNNPWVKSLFAARTRCGNPNNNGYKLYGAKGIMCLLTVRQIRYLFERDGAWQMKHPSLDRINPKGNYDLGNCRYIEWGDNVRRARTGCKASKETLEKMSESRKKLLSKRTLVRNKTGQVIKHIVAERIK